MEAFLLCPRKIIAVRAGSLGRNYRMSSHAFHQPVEMRNIHAVQSGSDAGAISLIQSREWCCTTSIQAARSWYPSAGQSTELHRKGIFIERGLTQDFSSFCGSREDSSGVNEN
jgi:hypothetical protein